MKKIAVFSLLILSGCLAIDPANICTDDLSQDLRSPVSQCAGDQDLSAGKSADVPTPGLEWNAFLKGIGCDAGRAITVDDAGNVYVVGDGHGDAFVAKFNSEGILQWHRFLGGSMVDSGSGIAVDGSGNVYVAGSSASSWGDPKRPFSEGLNVFLAKITAHGNLQWHTFSPGSFNAISVDPRGNITLFSYISFHPTYFKQTVHFSASGNILKTILSPPGGNKFNAADHWFIDQFGNIFGTGYFSWWDTFEGVIGVINADLSYKWGDSFFNCANTYGNDITADGSGNAYVTGASSCNYSHVKLEAYIAKFSQYLGTDSAEKKWDTYLGGDENDSGSAITIDSDMNTYIAGDSKGSWGAPRHFFSGGSDAFIAKVNENGELLWHAFFGGSGSDDAKDIAIDELGSIYILGTSTSKWGDPRYSFQRDSDVFLAKVHDFSGILNAMTLKSPNGGENWVMGTKQNIAWETARTIAEVKIEYTLDNGAHWIEVIAATANNGIYPWTVPATPSSRCLVRISDVVDAAISDTSDAIFSILLGLDLQAERREIKAFSIMRQYGAIRFLGAISDYPVAQYRLMRRKGNEVFVLLKTIAPSELQNNQFQMQDKYLEKDIPYTYRVEAYDAAGQLIGISSEKTI